MRHHQIMAMIAGLFVSGAVLAAVGADEANQLGDRLTPWGAEKAGNKDGTIPAYTGEPIKVPASYDPKKPGQMPDPFNEKPLFTITAQNVSQHADKLDGYADMFKRFPNFRMDIYPTHRSWRYPKWFTENTLKNATACRAVDNELKLEGCYAGMPFPIPKTGNQAMWNHLLQFEANSTRGILDLGLMPTSGPYVLQASTFLYQNWPFYTPVTSTPRPSNTVYWRLRANDSAPQRRAGYGILVTDSLDQANVGRRAWLYIPGQRRVKLAPDLAYDTPNPYAGGAGTMDDVRGFIGALDRFDFTLTGKKEKYVPYNNYALFDNKACSTEKIGATKNFVNPDCVRFELHRVWVVEAKLKPNFRHIYAKRKFYWDEDAPGSGMSENYDHAGKLFRAQFVAAVPYYQSPGYGGTTGMSGISDFTNGVASFQNVGSGASADYGIYPAPDKEDVFFSPETLAGEGVR